MYLEYAGIRVTSLVKAVRFFEIGLGLKEVRRGTMDHGGVWVLLQDGVSQQRIELNWYPKGSKWWAEFAPGEGLDHLGVRVNDIPKAARRLKRAGARLVSEIRERGRVEVAYYEGPDGIWVELILSPSE